MMEPGGGFEPVVELSFHGQKLKNMDLFSRSDPFIVMYVGQQSSVNESDFRMVGRTETIWDNLDPNFVTKLYLPFKPIEQEKTRVLLQYFDQDSKEGEELSKEYLKNQDFIGQVIFNMAELMSVDHQLLSLRLSNRRNQADPKAGVSLIKAEVITGREEPITYEIEFRFTADCEMPKKKKIFLILSRSVKNPSSIGPSWTPVYRTGAMEPPGKSGQEFSFQDFTITAEQLYALDEDRSLKIELYTHKRSGAHALQGSVVMSINTLRRAPADKMFPIKLEEHASLQSGYVFQPGSFVASGSTRLGLRSSLRFCFTRLSWRMFRGL